MHNYDLDVLDMLGCIYEDLDTGKTEEKFVELVSEVFGFDRVALFFVQHKKEFLTGKLAKGFDAAVIRNTNISLKEDSLFIKPLVSGLPYRNAVTSNDQYAESLGASNFAVIPILNKKRVACWQVKNCQLTDCPAYGKKWLRCWLVADTKCSNGTEAGLNDKKKQCASCTIFNNMNVNSSEGVIIVDNSLSHKPIGDDVVTALSIIANTVGIAVNNAKRYQKTLDLAIKDPITELHNRRYFNERLLDEVEHARRYDEALSLIICDIDLFKTINDSYGHPVGDAVLKWTGDTLRKSLRRNDIITRYGGEEFASILLNTDKQQAIQIAEKLRNAFEQSSYRHSKGNASITITMSFGVAALGSDSHTFDGLVASADHALYCAKALGRNRVCAGEQMQFDATSTRQSNHGSNSLKI